MNTQLDQQRLKEVLRYDRATGVFSWKPGQHGRPIHKTGTNQNGYVSIVVDGSRYYAHRLAWLWVYGRWPAALDHINRKKKDNRIENLRETTNAQNQQNVYFEARQKSGNLGAKKDGSRYRSRIRVEGKRLHLGCYGTARSASNAYRFAKGILHRFGRHV